MTKQHAIILTLLVLIPVVAFMALGKKLIDGEREVVQQRLRTLLTQNLAEIDRSIIGYFSQRQRELVQMVGELQSPDDLREAVRTEPMVQQMVLLDSDAAIKISLSTKTRSIRIRNRFSRSLSWPLRSGNKMAPSESSKTIC